ncbi:hypothetical protein [Actinophytocola xanthii]|uniref:Uncharacterized protein n=1 Tax=Actinophytocola xanthii TaxID=1912961 RepID=A0A1Q8BWC6_9PSEU|nr:hypothetical protein [Actinophytocola xanthii]OLF06411.1 hypothetical protein BU204_36425 [Actinophytocola xanthii]
MRELTRTQHDRLLNLVRRSPAFLGMRVVVHEDRVEVRDPAEVVLGLGPVVDVVVGAPWDQWPDLVDDRLARMLTAVVEGSPELDGPTEGVLERVYARLRPVAGSPTGWWTYAREVAPGLLMVLALDHPDRVAVLNDDQVERHGYDRLLRAGLDNLCTQLPDTYATREDVHVLVGGDHVASTVLVLPWVVEVVIGVVDQPFGVLVGIPDHTTLVFHVLRDGAGARHAVREIARVAADQHARSDVPLSREVYWWRPGSPTLEPVAQRAGTADGVLGEDLVTRYPPGFVELLEELDRRPL